MTFLVQCNECNHTSIAFVSPTTTNMVYPPDESVGFIPSYKWKKIGEGFKMKHLCPECNKKSEDNHE